MASDRACASSAAVYAALLADSARVFAEASSTVQVHDLYPPEWFGCYLGLHVFQQSNPSSRLASEPWQTTNTPRRWVHGVPGASKGSARPRDSNSTIPEMTLRAQMKPKNRCARAVGRARRPQPRRCSPMNASTAQPKSGFAALPRNGQKVTF